MNDIFKLFKKRAQSGKNTNITDVIKDLNEKEQNEIMGSDGVGKFERGSKSYLSISKSGRLKSKKSQNSRALQDDLFNPVSTKLNEIASRENRENNIMTNNNNNSHHNGIIHHHNGINRNVSKKSPYEPKRIYDQNSDNADSSRTSSTSSSFRSSYEDLHPNHNPHHHPNGFNSKSQIHKKQAPLSTNCHQSALNSNYLQTANRNNIVSSAGIRSNMRYLSNNHSNNNNNHNNNTSNGFKRF